MLVTMKEILEVATKKNFAVAAPNVDNEINLRACIEAAEAKNAPLILDVTYDSTVDIATFGRLCRKLANQSRVPIALNLDHGASKKEVIAAINAGFTSVMFDRSAYSNEINTKEVKEIVDIAHEIGISVEAELGHVGQASNYDADRNAALTSPEEAVKFIEDTGVDCLAVAIGTAHGAYPRGHKPYLDFDRLCEIKKATNNFPLVLHGSSGTDEDSIKRACQLGINKVNIANDLYKQVVRTVREKDFEGNKAYNVFAVIKEDVKQYLMHMIDIYGSTDEAWSIAPKGLPAGKTDSAE